MSGGNGLTAVNQNDFNNSGTLVSTLIAGKVNDVDVGALAGIAVTAVVNTHGNWQYTTDSGTTWQNFGAPALAAARLLAADATERVRFVPNLNWSGAVSGGLTFVAWDRTSGTNGGTASAVVRGGTTAFSSASASSSVTVVGNILVVDTTSDIVDGNTSSIAALIGTTAHMC